MSDHVKHLIAEPPLRRRRCVKPTALLHVCCRCDRSGRGAISRERGAMEGRSRMITRLNRLLDAVALAEARAEEISDLLPHLGDVLVACVGDEMEEDR